MAMIAAQSQSNSTENPTLTSAHRYRSLDPQDPDAISPQPDPFANEADDDATSHSSPVVVPSLKEKRSRWNSIKLYLKNILIVVKTGRPYYDDYRRFIEVEIVTTNAKGRTRTITRGGMAMVDPHCPENVLSREFAALFGIEIEDSTDQAAEAAFVTVKGEQVKVLKTVPVRWYCEETNVPSRCRFGFDPRFLDGTFYITDSESRFDAIIGSHTLDDLGLPLIGPSFRARKLKTEPVDPDQRKERLKENEAAMEKDLQAKGEKKPKPKPKSKP